ncbi:MAG: hypothetical protein ACREFE_10120 [Limisphaerales bacterium]
MTIGAAIEDLCDFEKIPLDTDVIWREGHGVPPLSPQRLTNDRRRAKTFPNADFEFAD